MPLVGTRGGVSARAYGFTSGSGPEVLGGMVLVAPASVDVSGTGSSATVNANGSISFTSCTSVSLNGVFTADYDNYMIVTYNTSTGSLDLSRLRVAGSDSTATTDYNDQNLVASSTSVSALRTTSSGYWSMWQSGSNYTPSGTAYIYGPFLAQPTAFRSLNVDSDAPVLRDYAGTHELSTSYDGITIYTSSTTGRSGLISVYGLVGA